MELLTKKVPVDFNYFLFSCTHFGSIFHHKRGWEKLSDLIHSKIDGIPESKNFGIHHGDALDFIDPRDLRTDWEELLATGEEGFILEQIETAKRCLSTVSDKMIALLMGNHEFAKQAWGNVTKKLCNDLKIPYGGWSCKITFLNKSRGYLFKHYATHGSKSITSTADDPKRRRTNRQLILKRLLKNKCADAVLMSRAHTHICERLKPESDVFFSDDGHNITTDTTKADHTAEYIHPDLRWYVSAGAFYKQYAVGSGLTSYAERKDYDPLRLGFQLAKIRSGKIKSIEPVWMD